MSLNLNNTNVEFISETSNKNTDKKNLSDWDIIGSPSTVNKPSSNPTSPLLENIDFPLNDLNKLSFNTEELDNEEKTLNKPPLAGNPELDDFDDDELENDESLKPKTIDEAKDSNSENVDELIKDIFNLDPDSDLTVRAGADVPDGANPTKPHTVPPLVGFPPSYPGGFPPYVGYAGGVLGDDGMITLPNGEKVPDVNVYQHKKTLAQGMMDLALFSANANQLRYVLESASDHPYFYPGIFMISVSLLLQVLVGMGLIWNSRYNVKDEKQICIANKINNFTVVGIFIVTVINVFISAFGVAKSS